MLDRNISPSAAPIEYWHMVLRRKWLVLAIFFACVGVGGILCVVWPESYRSSTLILVESQKIPEEYVKTLIGSSIEERLNSIQQQVMSRTLLTQMIQEFNLYSDAVHQGGNEAVYRTLGARECRRICDFVCAPKSPGRDESDCQTSLSIHR
jgi:uncharacterized protein involved in exopolysaccharide biosynthesis